MRKVIVPVGYMGSGSSAVTDFVSEFENVNNDYGEFEYVFLHCPNGVFDLEDKLLVGNNAIRSDEAIHSFLQVMKELYDKKYWWVGNYKTKVGENFYSRTEQYIDELVDFSFDNYWYYQENTNCRMFWQLIIRKIIYILSFKKISLKKPLLYEKMFLSYPSKEKFYQITKKYIYDVLNMMGNSDEDLLLDKLLLPYNLFRVDHYFDDDVKIIVIQRDPRDVFLLNKYVWLEKLDGVPFSVDVKEFCKQYRQMRQMEKEVQNKNVYRIHFEDLIYNYEKTTQELIKFLGYENREHVRRKERFNPDISIKNTRIFENEKYQFEAKYIEENLQEYLYPFNDVIKETNI